MSNPPQRTFDFSDRGQMLRILKEIPLSKLLADTLRAVDDLAKGKSSWDGTRFRISQWMRVSERTVRRTIKQLQEAMLLSDEQIASDFISDPHRRDREGRDFENVYRFRPNWPHRPSDLLIRAKSAKSAIAKKKREFLCEDSSLHTQSKHILFFHLPSTMKPPRKFRGTTWSGNFDVAESTIRENASNRRA